MPAKLHFFSLTTSRFSLNAREIFSSVNILFFRSSKKRCRISHASASPFLAIVTQSTSCECRLRSRSVYADSPMEAIRQSPKMPDLKAGLCTDMVPAAESPAGFGPSPKTRQRLGRFSSGRNAIPILLARNCAGGILRRWQPNPGNPAPPFRLAPTPIKPSSGCSACRRKSPAGSSRKLRQHRRGSRSASSQPGHLLRAGAYYVK